MNIESKTSQSNREKITVFICDIALCGTIGATPLFWQIFVGNSASPLRHLIFSQHCSFPQTNPPQFGSLAVSAWTWNRACNYEAFCWTQSSWTGHRLSWYPGMGACCFILWKIGVARTQIIVLSHVIILQSNIIYIYIIAWIWIRWGYHATVIKLELCYILLNKNRHDGNGMQAKTSETTTRPNLLV